MMDSPTRRPLGPLSTNRIVVVVVSLLTVSSLGILAGQTKPQKGSLYKFEHVGMNIFVPVTIAGPDGRSETVDFIVDSGTTRTTIDNSVARDLTLLRYRTSSNITPSGTSLRDTTITSHLCSLSQCGENFEVLVDDLSLYTKGYGRRVGGLLAMDFLRDYILLLDFPNSRIGLFSGHTRLKEVTNPKIVKLIPEKGLDLIEAVLPNGKTVRLMFDTGYDSAADAQLYQSSSGQLDFVQTGQDKIGDVNGSFRTVRVGEIKSLKIGEFRLAPALIQLSDSSSEEQSKLEYDGNIGIFPFRECVITVDYPKLELLVSARCNDDPKSKRNQ